MIVYDNGRSGFLGEHSCMDGTPTLRMNEFVLASIATGKAHLGPEQVDASRLPRVQELVFELNYKVKNAIKDAEARFDELVGKHHLQVQFILESLQPPFLTFFFPQKGITLHRVRKELSQRTSCIPRRNCSNDQTTCFPYDVRSTRCHL